VANVFEPEWEDLGPEARPAPFCTRHFHAGRAAGARELGAAVYELGPGETSFPLHFHHANEEMLCVLAGRPTLRTLEDRRPLEPGEVVAFPAGRAGAHRVDNETSEPVRILLLSTMRSPDIVEYPDSGKVGVRDPAPGAVGVEGERLRLNFLRDSAVGYWEGEVPEGP
jgi:uncharacterized cupin superfamily protein